ncbi:ABC-type dipeptide transport system, periplasmic component [Candidatus Vecturithrix granuli]|uniref:ABC-type dipeptide transport system, periplasmic component n=1 Tax=Vecturithrix granuli TaxID=1499967 RepID=A0A081BVR8_VECG1|nr:ABC-type dipeptide transport system, periplasmic component [Candidatus Vecturithrix granuli]
MIFCLFVALSVGLFIANHAFAQKDTLIIGMQDNSLTLDPAMHVQISEVGYIDQLYEKLVIFEMDDFTTPVPDLAESWEVAEDGRTWTFHLRKDALFASGNPVTADDVVFSFQRVIKLTGDQAWLLKQFGITENSIVKVDGQTVQIGLEKQYAPGVFFACLSHAIAGILDQKLVLEHEENGDLGKAWLVDHSAGSGRFVISERTPRVETILTANPHYRKKVTPLQKVIVRNIEEPIEQAVYLEQGEIDLAWDLQQAEIMRLETEAEIQTFKTPILELRYVAMNLWHPPLDKPEVRDAIRYAIDYDGIIDYILQGAGTKIQTIIPKGVFGYNPAMPYQRDLAKAKQLLAEAGYANGFEVELSCLNFSPWLDMALKIKADLAEIGITVAIKELTYPELIKKVVMARDYQMFLLRWGFDYIDPDAMAKPFAHCNSHGEDATFKITAWVTHYCDNQELTRLVEDATQELDLEKREAMYQKITESVLEDGPYAVLYTPEKQFAVRMEARDFVGIPSIMFGGFPNLR